MKSDKELLSVIASYEKQGIGGDTGALATERAEALDRYFGRAYGNEQEGHSQVVSTDVAETIEWIMPSLMRIFTTSEEAVRFDPQGPEDEKQSRQETDYCNYIFYIFYHVCLFLYHNQYNKISYQYILDYSYH